MILDSNNNKNSYLTQVEYIRAIASLGVAQFHLGGKALPILNFGWLGVEMFFVLSGFIICWSIPLNYTLTDSKTFFIKRITRIEPPYIASIILVLIINHLIINNYKTDWASVAMHLAYINSFVGKDYLNVVYWTLGAEFQFYIFISLFFPWIISKWGPLLLLFISSIPCLFKTPFDMFPLFVIGIIGFLRFKQIITTPITLTLLFIVSGLSIYTIGTINTAAGLLTLGLIFLPLPKNKIISFLSKISFSLYLTHDIVGSRLVIYAGRIVPDEKIFKGFIFLLGILISIVVAYLFYLIFEKPFFTISKKFFYKRDSKESELLYQPTT